MAATFCCRSSLSCFSRSISSRVWLFLSANSSRGPFLAMNCCMSARLRSLFRNRTSRYCGPDRPPRSSCAPAPAGPGAPWESLSSIERACRFLPLQFRGQLPRQRLLLGDLLVDDRLAHRPLGRAHAGRGKQLQVIQQPLGGGGIDFVHIGDGLAEPLRALSRSCARSAASPCWNKA